MPIFDHDGTTLHQLGKVYDHDGSTSHQIGKVYDNDGTASHLIYTAETQVYPGTTVQYLPTSNQGTYGAFWAQMSGNYSNNLNSTVPYITVNLTEFKSMTILGAFESERGLHSCSGVWLSSPSQWNTDIVRYPYYTIYIDGSQYCTKMDRSSGFRAENPNFYSVTWDVSGLSGTYYLAIGCYVNGGANWAYAKIDSITLV